MYVDKDHSIWMKEWMNERNSLSYAIDEFSITQWMICDSRYLKITSETSTDELNAFITYISLFIYLITYMYIDFVVYQLLKQPSKMPYFLLCSAGTQSAQPALQSIFSLISVRLLSKHCYRYFHCNVESLKWYDTHPFTPHFHQQCVTNYGFVWIFNGFCYWSSLIWIVDMYICLFVCVFNNYI